jgi:hypothetical protein
LTVCATYYLRAAPFGRIAFANTDLSGAASQRNEISERSAVESTFAHALRQGAIPPSDNTLFSRSRISADGLSFADAEKRVSDVFAEAQQSMDSARKALAHLSLWLFVALLSRAFLASCAGTIGESSVIA